MRRTSLPVVVLGTIIAVACLEPAPFIPQIETTTFDPSLGVNLESSIQTELGVYYRDLVVGGGAIVPVSDTGDTVVVRYTGYLRNAVEFDSNEDPGDPLFQYVVGTAGTMRAITGFDDGVRGMREGGRRQIIIPPHLGYGRAGTTGIPPYSILVFEVSVTRIGFVVVDPDARAP